MVMRELNTNGAFITHEMLDEFRAMGADPLIKISFDCLGHHDWLRRLLLSEALRRRLQ